MAQGELDRFPVGELPRRWGISRSVAYKRMQELGIQGYKDGRRSYVTGEQLQLLDELDAHIRADGTVAEFLERKGIAAADKPAKQQQADASVERFTDTVERLAEAFGGSEIPEDPLWDLRQLQAAEDHGWLLSSRRLALILGLTPQTINKRRPQFESGGFLLVAHKVVRRQQLWRVTRPK